MKPGVSSSFSSKVKEELAAAPLGARCCLISEMSALMYTASTLAIDEDNALWLCIVSRSASAVNRSIMLTESLLNEHVISAEWSGDQARRILTICGLLGDQGWFAVTDVERPVLNPKPCCRAAFLRGAFLGGGSAADPAKEYHLEFISADERLAETLTSLLESLRLTPRAVTRKNQRVVYLKEAEQIAALLTHMGAAASRLRYEDARILKDMRNRVNRATNCDSANLDKAVDAADRQIRAIELIIRASGLGSLPDQLREIAEARLAHPELSLVELGRTLNPTVGKSGVNHRLRKLEDIAQTLGRRGFE
ncbi:putative sporulation transcription regulator WhiA [Clostridia bacterium]|nr:putative sporulation transcription regulator WhiA [Clostridia bacterium]